MSAVPWFPRRLHVPIVNRIVSLADTTKFALIP